MPSDGPPFTYTPDDTESLSAALVEAISQAKGRDITEDNCVLYDNIDPTALDALFRNGDNENTIQVEFTTHSAVVVLWGGDEVTIEVQDLE